METMYYKNKSSLAMECSLTGIYSLLISLGISAENLRFFYMSYAIFLVAQQPDRSIYPSRWLYPQIAQHYNSTVICVTRELQSVVDEIYTKNGSIIQAVSMSSTVKPSTGAFLLAAVRWLQSPMAA